MDLAGFELRGFPCRSDNRKPPRAELIDDSRYKRRFGTHNGHFHAGCFRYRQVIGRRDRGSDFGDPRISRRAPNLMAGLRQPPRQRMLAPAASNDEDFHANR